jgi:hypothetical protein
LLSYHLEGNGTIQAFIEKESDSPLLALIEGEVYPIFGRNIVQNLFLWLFDAKDIYGSAEDGIGLTCIGGRVISGFFAIFFVLVGDFESGV